ncbi:nitroreductase family deazaflavin-dependent oxidoreductase [Novosphingobium sp. G106]|uniref:nitroreductase family deazaflavin-dependent oxidoreductase n=1 Tax=Novosphingobium sp. G106 TaxID=2849500 RepID=UPI001C2DBB09|nr:nitroreductase family deazaflavin-dependent oxidoreductase [Novosphingobium sp. G106]MBV1691560.1 nitroreductase family deazaflavin-dependent oxidoreductase [Novosphingobium sp. G106]
MSDTPPRSNIGTDLTLLGDEHVKKYRETDGEIGYMWNGATACLLTTKGRKSGEDRTIAIIYKQVGDRYAIIASKGGSPTHPIWYLNVEADPHVRMQIKGEKFAGVARIAEGAEREELWQASLGQWPNYDVYQSRTDRKIPVVVVERAK